MSGKQNPPLWSLHPVVTMTSLLDEQPSPHSHGTRRAGEYVERRKPGEPRPASAAIRKRAAAAPVGQGLLERARALLLTFAQRHSPRTASSR